MQDADPLQEFHPIVQRWFRRAFGAPSPPQLRGWPGISSGSHTLILAPTGSGKTLAAFLWAINHLVEQRLREELSPGVRILYVSPLKALNNDIHRNLEEPLEGIREEAHREGLKLPPIRTAVRTGDTPASKRAAMLKHPPDILITTPESLYLMLTSKLARKMFRTVQYLIIDEIHSLCANKRGVHLSLSMERLAALADQEFVRIGLSATQRPLEQIAAFLGGQSWQQTATGRELLARPVNIIDAGQKKQMDLKVHCAAPDFSLLPQESVWPLVFIELLEHIRQHKTTLIFVNNRRLAERVAAKLNEMITGTEDASNLYAVPVKSVRSSREDSSDLPNRNAQSDLPLVQAYHGSMSRHAREQMEADLKGGRLRALVATSSLELGIDIGSIDLVIQLQSPKGVARGLQRVGRSGHLVSATSKGRIFPTHREDLVESAVVAREMALHDVEYTTIPKNCLDVLAQQIVAMVSVQEWDVDALFDIVRQSFCYRTLFRKLYLGVLQMLAGRYTHEAFRELRARISWDKVNNTLRALPGSSQLAITSGGTISDRGYFGVYLEDGKTKVGEVDEEFIYESRSGDTFILGTNVWRMMKIDANRLTVTPAPGQPARMPFWRGEGIGRGSALGKKVGAFRRAMAERIDSPDCLPWLQREYPIDSRSAWNIQEYFRKQRDATRVIPHDGLLLVEGFRDEIGDPRIVVHSSFGRRVNGLLALVLSHKVQQATATEPQVLYNDDGILLRCSDLDVLPMNLFDALTLEEANELVLKDILTSPLFGGQFRQNAARALLMPKIAPGKRTPLWLQRLRAGDLLQIARQFDDFPIVIETMREVLNDVLDFEHFQGVIREVVEGKIATVTVQTETPSPFAASLLFDFIAVYMYEWDQPRSEKLNRYLTVNRELLSEIVDLESMKSLLRPEAIDAVESQLQHTAEGYKARSPEELLEILLRVGDMTTEEVLDRAVDRDRKILDALVANGRAAPVTFPDGIRWIAGEEERLYAQRTADSAMVQILRRFLQAHGPVTTGAIAQRYALQPGHVEAMVESLSSGGEFIRGTFRPGREPEGAGQQWCYRPTLAKIHRQTIHLLRKEITPSSLPEFTHFLLHWQCLSTDRHYVGSEGLQMCATQLQGIPLPADIWEREIFGRRIREYARENLIQLTSSGGFVWAGAGSGRIEVISRGEGSIFLSPLSREFEDSLGEAAQRVLRYLRDNGASFFNDVRSGSQLSLPALNNGIAELFWSGMITNDLFTELQGVKRLSRSDADWPLERIELTDPRRNPMKKTIMQTARRAIKQVPGWSGRWSLVHLPGVMGETVSLEEQAHQQAAQVLQRYGIVAREFYRRENLLPWPLIAAELQQMEMRGEIRRGYFVRGLSGMQYALPAAVEELRRLRVEPANEDSVILVNACDPANPYGTGVELPLKKSGLNVGRMSRMPGNYLVFERGVPVMMFENSGSRIWTLADPGGGSIHEGLRLFTSMMKLPAHLRPFREITIEQCDGGRPTESLLEPTLRALGFRRERNQTMQYDGYV